MRSLLFVPADSPRKIEKALGSGADAIILDLEDSVALDNKPSARETVARLLPGLSADERADLPRLYVRVNAFDTGLTETDLDAAMAGAPDGIMLPKACGGRDVQSLSALIAAREASDIRGRTRILAIATEHARGVLALADYDSAGERLEGLAWGAEDLSADLGAQAIREADNRYTEPFRVARTGTLFAAVAAGVIPIDGVYGNFRDDAGLRHECAEAARDGFTAKMAIHPAQVPAINEAFTPSGEAVARARRIVDAFAQSGNAGVIGLDGEMLDRPHLTRAERLLERARRYGLA
ncbi:CoA ester lyase [Kaustia mangrovi]|uniref:CoA ester lyase n=1 Tax=Kaustia mangrovi TaxID=2593653 RepID=A0A7S8HAC4_9HYPH|nr:CoA ester lyase [Kaustia mangrovi]QPC41294.1 CoA ester lyase [Kaustia mangrovi]